MKRNLLYTITLLFLGFSAIAQNSVELNFQHTLGAELFAMNKGAQNNLGNDYEITRLQYYISGITIIHDGGLETPMTDVHILVDANKTNKVEFGDHSITAVEMIKFHVGVDPAFNHLDPASYAAFHPLAPKNPSMHWGWDPGYRFVAIEGNGGSNYDQLFQLHGLGDGNYFEATVEMDVMAENNKVAMYLSADCSKILEDIDVSDGVVVHGEGQAAKSALVNMSSVTFTASGPLSSTVNLDGLRSFEIFPNPTYTLQTEVKINADLDGDYAIVVSDILGRPLSLPTMVNGQNSVLLDLPTNGMYIVTLFRDNQPLTSKKVIVK